LVAFQPGQGFGLCGGAGLPEGVASVGERGAEVAQGVIPLPEAARQGARSHVSFAEGGRNRRGVLGCDFKVLFVGRQCLFLISLGGQELSAQQVQLGILRG
jgi:hypothetical protein